MNVVCFNVEGPLSPQDSACNLMKLFPNGDKVFEIISRYDGLLTSEGRPDYEPGDTPALIAPFLVYHEIKEEDITALARKATLTGGSVELISKLYNDDWGIFCISTSYKQYTLLVTRKLNIYAHNIACTIFPLDEIAATLCKEDFDVVQKIETDILNAYPADDDWIKKKLDNFYRKELSGTGVGPLLKQVRPVGGQHKVEALESFAKAHDKPLSQWVAIGDSITDVKMLQAVDTAGGLAIAFNADEYALPSSTMGLASTHLDDLWPAFEAWKRGGRPEVEKLVKRLERAGGKGDRGFFQWLAGAEDRKASLEIHRRIGQIVREEAVETG